MRETAAIAGEAARETAHDVRNAADRGISEAKTVGREAYRRAGDALAGVDSFVARNPVGALVAALGVGLVLGMFARK